MGDGAINPQPLGLNPVIKRPEVIETLNHEGQLLHPLGGLGIIAESRQGQLMVFGLRVGTQKTNPPI